MTNTVLFIHGMFMNALCWENWVERFSQAGYTCLAPSWKYHDGAPADLRAIHPNPALGKLTLDDVVVYLTPLSRPQIEKNKVDQNKIFLSQFS